MVSVFLVCGVWNGGGVCCCWSVSVRGVARVSPIPVQYSRALLSCHVLLLVGCVVCGWCVSVCGVRVVGCPLSAPPSSWWWVGALWMVGWHDEVGWHGDGRAGAGMMTSPSDVDTLLFRLCGGRVEWREWWCVRCPRVRVESGILYCPAPLFCIASYSVCLLSRHCWFRVVSL